MLTKEEILSIAKKQFTLDYNCLLSDFEKTGNTITQNQLLEGRRITESDGCFLKIMVISGRAIICADDKIKPWLEEHILDRNASWLFDYSNLRAIDNKLKEFGHMIDEISDYYLPKPVKEEVLPLSRVEWFEENDILQFKGDHRFKEAFIFDPNCKDILGVAAYDGKQIMGMAGATRDSQTLYQIGIDVLFKYRGRKVSVNLVSLLKQELLKRGVVPIYKTSVSHLISRNVAISSGFFPAWVEIYSKKI